MESAKRVSDAESDQTKELCETFSKSISEGLVGQYLSSEFGESISHDFSQLAYICIDDR